MRKLMTDTMKKINTYETMMVVALVACVVIFSAAWMHTFYG